jgi:hypothetical protein
MAACPAKPAATDVVAHATLKDVDSHYGGGRSAAGIAVFQPVLSRKIHDAILPRVRPAILALISDVSSRKNSDQILPTFAALPTMISAKNIGHHMARIELCSSSFLR